MTELEGFPDKLEPIQERKDRGVRFPVGRKSRGEQPKYFRPPFRHECDSVDGRGHLLEKAKA